ncbi:MAG: leucine-rich repeat protein [Christensenellales bacterium]
MKKISISFLCILLTVTPIWFVFGSAADEYLDYDYPYISGDFAYELNDQGGACIFDYRGNDKIIYIPSSLDGHPVQALWGLVYSGPWNQVIEEVYLPEGLEIIAGSGVNYLENIKTLHLPLSLKKIIGDSLGIVKDIQVDNEHPVFVCIERALYNKVTKTLVHYRGTKTSFSVQPGILEIGDAAFFGTQIEEIILPEGLESIGYMSFSVMKNLQRINLPSSLKYIDRFAFDGVNSGTSYNLSVSFEPGTYASRWYDSMDDIRKPELSEPFSVE